MATATFPIDAVNTLLDMVRGVTPFNLVAAIQAALEVANYIQSVFSATSVGKDQSMSLEEALSAAKAHHDGVSAEAISPELLTLIVQLVMKWISDILSKQSA